MLIQLLALNVDILAEIAKNKEGKNEGVSLKPLQSNI